DHASPFMLETCQVTSRLALPGITHVDGSARPQTVDEHAHPWFRALLSRFHERTGCPLVINTSFNVADEPIVWLVLESFLLDRESLPSSWPQLVAAFDRGYHGPVRGRAIEDNLYTFL
ncbi:MAG: carbamoyltransferase, partial [Deltaproteobacteria bacterium]